MQNQPLRDALSACGCIKMIANLAWNFDPFSGCAPDLLDVTHSATMLQPTSWETSVQTYLLAHAK